MANNGNLGKRKRDKWSEEAENDIDVLSLCKKGKWIECKPCNEFVTMQSTYGLKNWLKHKDTIKHKKNAGKKTTPITNFFSVVESPGLDEEMKVPDAPKPKKCPGIYSPKKSDRLLMLMTVYGETESNGVEISKNENGFVARVMSCNGNAMV